MDKSWDVDKIIKLIAAIVILAVFAMNSIATYYHTIPEGNRDASTRTASIIETIIVLLTGYYFGSSLSSKHNRDSLNRITEASIPTGGSVESKTTTTTVKQADPPATT